MEHTRRYIGLSQFLSKHLFEHNAVFATAEPQILEPQPVPSVSNDLTVRASITCIQRQQQPAVFARVRIQLRSYNSRISTASMASCTSRSHDISTSDASDRASSSPVSTVVLIGLWNCICRYYLLNWQSGSSQVLTSHQPQITSTIGIPATFSQR